MIDASKYSFEENVRITKQVVEYAHKHNVTVEAEVGCVEASKKGEDNFYTDPDVAIKFIKETGCDSLAVSIGTGHGLMKFKENEKPQLRFDILAKVKENPVPENSEEEANTALESCPTGAIEEE